ncbi:hypothetical protein FPCIR_3248 [Fusarium pseudocircinatum]|uniref:Uncharacterized protein n=1 Tax=Fusarium pseudocircinatum TaxID=56676 RepID=A0A8H5PJV2_9HYPO|nr:hypothetical protein FPCIR_3248 [Fusarium pseudocircinatum]
MLPTRRRLPRQPYGPELGTPRAQSSTFASRQRQRQLPSAAVPDPVLRLGRHSLLRTIPRHYPIEDQAIGSSPMAGGGAPKDESETFTTCSFSAARFLLKPELAQHVRPVVRASARGQSHAQSSTNASRQRQFRRVVRIPYPTHVPPHHLTHINNPDSLVATTPATIPQAQAPSP